jgi:threonine dehydrogenase-like Zn-dependent dehydrogenase
VRVTNIHGPGDLRVDEAPDPTCGDRDVLVAMKACGVCGTDLTYLHFGGLPIGGGPRPFALGHEPAGEVAAIGKDVIGVHVGMRVVFNPCFDEADMTGNGGTQGALSELVRVRDATLGANLFAIPDEVPYEVAALTEPLSVALHAVNQGKPEPGQTAVVFGAGPVGVGIVAWLKVRGLRDVVAVDMAEPRLRVAGEIGADATVLGNEDVVAVLRERHGTANLLGSELPATDLWFDAAGSPQAFEQIMRGTRPHATVVVVAVHKEPVSLDLVNLLTKELMLTASMAYPTEFSEVADAIASHWRTFAPMVTDLVPFDDVAGALARAGSGATDGKVTIVF